MIIADYRLLISIPLTNSLSMYQRSDEVIASVPIVYVIVFVYRRK